MPNPNDILSDLQSFLNDYDQEIDPSDEGYGEPLEKLVLTRVQVEDIVDVIVDLQDEITMADDNAAYLETENDDLQDEIENLRDELDTIHEISSG